MKPEEVSVSELTSINAVGDLNSEGSESLIVSITVVLLHLKTASSSFGFNDMRRRLRCVSPSGPAPPYFISTSAERQVKRPAALSWEVRDPDARGQDAAVIQAAVLAGLRRGRRAPPAGAVMAKSGGTRLQLQHLIMTLRLPDTRTALYFTFIGLMRTSSRLSSFPEEMRSGSGEAEEK